MNEKVNKLVSELEDSMVELAFSFEFIDYIFEKYVKYVHNNYSNDIENLLERVIRKYESDSYKERENKSKSIFTRDLYTIAFEYAEKYGISYLDGYLLGSYYLRNDNTGQTIITNERPIDSTFNFNNKTYKVIEYNHVSKHIDIHCEKCAFKESNCSSNYKVIGYCDQHRADGNFVYFSDINN